MDIFVKAILFSSFFINRNPNGIGVEPKYVAKCKETNVTLEFDGRFEYFETMKWRRVFPKNPKELIGELFGEDGGHNNSAKHKGRYVLFKNGNLGIENLEGGDAGLYEREIKNGGTLLSEINLNVLTPPNGLPLFDPEVKYMNGEYLHLSCKPPSNLGKPKAKVYVVDNYRKVQTNLSFTASRGAFACCLSGEAVQECWAKTASKCTPFTPQQMTTSRPKKDEKTEEEGSSGMLTVILLMLVLLVVLVTLVALFVSVIFICFRKGGATSAKLNNDQARPGRNEEDEPLLERTTGRNEEDEPLFERTTVTEKCGCDIAVELPGQTINVYNCQDVDKVHIGDQVVCNVTNNGETSDTSSCSSDDEEESCTLLSTISANTFNENQVPSASRDDTCSHGEALKGILDNMDDWTNDENLPENCELYVHQLFECFDNVKTQNGNTEFWIKELKGNKKLSNFLLKIKDLEVGEKLENFETIQVYLVRLRSPAGNKLFKNSKLIKHWLDSTFQCDGLENDIDQRKIESLEDFHAILKDEFVPSLRKPESNDFNKTDTDRKKLESCITATIFSYVESLKECFQKNADNENIVFLDILLHHLSFNHKYGVFDPLLNVSKLESFLPILQNLMQGFQTTAGVNKHLFLIQKAITVCISKTYSILRERDEIFMKILQPILPNLDHGIAKVLSTFTGNCPCDFDSLSNELKLFKRRVHSSDEQLDFVRLRESLNMQADPTYVQNIPIGELSDLQRKILETFHMAKYLSCGIELKDVMKIQKALSMDDPSNVPWIILRNIITLNYKGRDQVMHIFSNPEEGSSQLSDDDDDDDDDDLSSILESNLKMTDPFSPLDVFITLFCCCSPSLKQVLVQKMFLCQLAVPLVYQPLLEGNHYLSLWPLRTLRIEGRALPLINDFIKIASFIRIKRPVESKSDLLSRVLSENGHDIFYNHNCYLGETRKEIATGMIEVSWYIPSNEKEENIKEMVTCLNLRGDAIESPKLVTFLKDISDVVFVLVDANDILHSECSNIFLSLYSSTTTIVLLPTGDLQSPENKNNISKFCKIDLVKTNLKRTKIIPVSSRGGHTNTASMKQNIRKHMATSELKTSRYCMADCVSVASSHHISVDENMVSICNAKKRATEIISFIRPDTDTASIIEETFKLQEKILNDSKEDRNCRPKPHEQEPQTPNQIILNTHETLRMQQLYLCDNLSPAIYKFIETLVAYQDSHENLRIFLIWLHYLLNKRFLDAPFVKKTEHPVTPVHLDQHIPNSLKEQPTIQYDLFIRELGQIYEAVNENDELVSLNSLEQVEKLPLLVAKLLLCGHGIEIMDGDHSSVPMKWIKAVLSKLQKLTSNSKILVVSIVGMQSSGKSTLANAMFGLQFNVSAGRCSKGVFMQMIPVDQNQANEYGYDYVFVLDSEGLRSQETSASEFAKDNRLATFVIGMSDMCLVNIKGENYAEMKNFLHIVVFAFIKLKIANGNINLHQTCLFLHQNVSAPDAGEKTRVGRQSFVQSLDEVTRIAAEQEGDPEIKQFSDVIEFDHRKHCWYFKDFWNGNPPMAAVNPTYGEYVNDIRHFVTTTSLEKKTFLRILDLSEHMEDLWNGICSDEFIYSFENSLGVKAYNILEGKCNSFRGQLESNVDDLIARKIEENITTADTDQVIIEMVLQNIQKGVKASIYNIKKEMETYMEKSEFCDVFLTWKQSKLLAIERLNDDFMDKAKKYIDEKQNQLGLDENLSKMKKDLQEEVGKAAKQYSENLKDKIPTNDELNQHFNKKWRAILQNWVKIKPDTLVAVEPVIESKLLSHFNRFKPQLKEEIKRNPLFRHVPHKKLYGSITQNDIEKKHIQIKRRGLIPRKMKSSDQCILQTIELTDKLLMQIDRYLNNLVLKDTKFEESFVDTLLYFVDEGINTYNEENAEQQYFSIRPSYHIKLCVHVCKYSFHTFQAMNANYEKNHNVMHWYESQRTSMEEYFKRIVDQKTEEKSAASKLCDCLEDALFRRAKDKLFKEVEIRMLKQFSNSKTKLLSMIMLDLLEQNSNSLFQKYADEPFEYALQWITLYTKTYFLKYKDNGTSVASEISGNFINGIARAVEESALHATNRVAQQRFGAKTKWLQHFREGITGQLHVTENSLKEVENKKITNIHEFQKIVLNQLYFMKEKVIRVIGESFGTCIMEEGASVYKSITDTLWGCPAVCPFCDEPCRHTDREHVKQGKPHACIQHRPLALNGISEPNGESEKLFLVSDPCHALVRSQRTFKCSWSKNKCKHSEYEKHEENKDHPFKNFNKYFPDWFIKSSSKAEDSSFWCYYLSLYGFNLKQKYGYGLQIPQSWRKIDKKTVRKSLQKISQM